MSLYIIVHWSLRATGGCGNGMMEVEHLARGSTTVGYE